MPTVRRCCIVGCMSNSRQAPSLQFFQFPRPDNPFYKLWTQACQASLSRILPFKKPVVCALHFHPHCIGGRRLTGSAVPTLKLEVPSNLKAVEQQAMVEEIERSRKCAYINAVVYEWLVRANLNPQLRGSITHGMIKEKAETAKQIIGCDSFMADNRWLNRFRETHLTGFAQKLASNQLKPIGPSLWIPDIVQDLAHLFPPTNAERIESFENVPEQYMTYMKQYGEYEEEDDISEQEPAQTYQQEHNNSYGQDSKIAAQSYYQQQQVAQSYYQQQHHQQQHHQQQHHQQQHHQQQQNGYHHYNSHPHAAVHPAAGYNSYHDYYSERPPHPQQHYHHQHHPPPHNGGYGAHPLHPAHSTPIQHHVEQTPVPMPPAQPQQQQTQQQSPSRPLSHSPPQQNGLAPIERASPYSPSPSAVKRPRSAEPDNDAPSSKSARTSPVNCSTASSPTPPTLPISKTPPTVTDNSGETKSINNNNIIDNSFKIKLPLANGSGGGGNSSGANSQRSSTPNSQANNLNSRSNSPKSLNGGQTTNGNTSPTPSQSTNATKDLETYAQALEYLKPLEDFALFKENFRAIGLISQLEIILKKANKSSSVTKSIAAE